MERLRRWINSLPRKDRELATQVGERIHTAVGDNHAQYIDRHEIVATISKTIIGHKLRERGEKLYEGNCLSHWFPLIERAGLPVPRTTIIRTKLDLVCLLDGEPPAGWDEFLAVIQAACEDHDPPCFLRTGQGSGKHSWDECCYVSDVDRVGWNIARLVEWSHTVDLMGLPHDIWVVRDLIPTEPLFHCPSFGNFPVTREFRFFMRSGQLDVEHVQPYWPSDAVAQGDPDVDDWEERLAAASELGSADFKYLNILAHHAVEAVGGFWSIDFLQAANGEWWLCDMALGERSFRWEP